jgi:hypothetical protein
LPLAIGHGALNDSSMMPFPLPWPYRVLNYHKGNFVGICTGNDRWNAHLRFPDPEKTGLEVGSIVEVRLRVARFVYTSREEARRSLLSARLAAELVGQQDSRVMIQAKCEKALKDALVEKIP